MVACMIALLQKRRTLLLILKIKVGRLLLNRSEAARSGGGARSLLKKGRFVCGPEVWNFGKKSEELPTQPRLPDPFDRTVTHKSRAAIHVLKLANDYDKLADRAEDRGRTRPDPARDRRLPAKKHWRRMRTRGDLLSFAIAFALRGARKLVRGLRQELTEEERYRVADDVVHQLKQHGDPWRLSEELPPPRKGHST
jgi:hypothetical protein